MNNLNNFSRRAMNLKPSPIRELFKYSSNREIISFGGGYPAPDTFPVSEITLKTIYDQEITVSRKDILSMLQYGPSRGDSGLLSKISDWHFYKDGVKLEKDNFLILNGSQEGIFALGFLYINDQDLVCITEPTYPGTLSAFNAFSPSYLSVPVAPDGMDIDFLDSKLKKLEKNDKKMPRFIYVIPNGHNPAGVTMSLQCRMDLLEVSGRYGIPVIEDDPYELIRFHDNPLPTLQALDKNQLVIRLDSFSKILIPGLRIGYISAGENVIKMTELFKQSSNLHTSSFAQGLLFHYLEGIGFEGFLTHIKKVSGYYKDKMEYTASLLDEHLGNYATFSRPDSGLFIWLTFKKDMDVSRMLFDNTDRFKVIGVPGSSFSTGKSLRNSLRLSFGTLDNPVIKEGILRLRSLVEFFLSKDK